MATYAISTALFRGWSVDETIPRLVEAGFHEVELSGGDPYMGNPLVDPAKTRRLFNDAGIAIRVIHSPSAGWDNGASDEAARLASIEVVAKSFLEAAEVGAEIVVCHPNKPSDPFTQENYAENLARSRDSMAVLAERAKAAGVKMAVENLPSRGVPRPGMAIVEVLKMIEGLGDHVGICLDAGHSNANGISAAKEVLDAGDRLFALHIQDNDGSGEDQHLLPGRGTTDWKAFLDALDEINFDGVRTFEVMRGDEIEVILDLLSELRQEWQAR